MQNAERRMHCLFAVSFTCVCLRLAFICWKGQHLIVVGPFQQIKANRKQTQVKLTASKQCIRRSAFCVRRSAFYPYRSTNFQGLVFIPKTEKLLLWHLKTERKNINRCLSGLRMENQGVQGSQTFLVKNFSCRQQPRKHDDRCAFK